MNRGNPVREFSAEVRKQERQAANNACRICGTHRNLVQLQSAHIYTHSKHPKWERAGGNKRMWQRDHYVGSIDNCLCLCVVCHGKIDSPDGLQLCTVSYLESLKTDTTHCTALISSKNQLRRCRKLNTGTKGNGYRCHLHLNGGLDAELISRIGWGNPAKKVKTTPQVAKKSKSCTII